MSQYPQPPMSPQPPPGYGAPPPPGYGAPPPPGQYGGYPMQGQPKKSNGAAIGSIVCGALSFCIPVVMGLVAVILGFIGLRKARDPQVGGKGLAIGGMVLGLLGLGMWALFGSAIFALFKNTDAQRVVARQVITDLSAGNVDAAAANTDPAGVTREELEALSAKMKDWGTPNDLTAVGFNAQSGQTQVMIGAQYGQTQRQFQATVKKGADGKYKVTDLQVQGQ